jgi:hypothetical protein
MANERARGLGYKYITDDKYLVNPFSPTEGISYEGDGSPVSYANSGIMSQAPIPAPLQYIPRDGGGDGRGPPGAPEDIGAVTADDYGYGPVGNMGMTEEEQAGVDSINNARPSVVDGLRAIGAFTIGGPINAGYSLIKSQERAEKKAIAKAKAAQQQRDREVEVQGIKSRLDSGKTLSDIGRESYTGSGMAFEARDTGTGRGPKKDGGRAGYFFGGRVNYKVGGRIGFKGGGGQIGGTDDMSGGSKSGKGFSDKDDTREQYGAKGQYDKGPTNNNNNGGNDKTFFQTPTTLYKNTDFGFNVPTGLTTGTPYGRLSAIMNLNKTIEEKELEGKVQFDRSIGPVNTRASYDTTIGPEFNASYTNNNLNANLNSKTGLGVNYSKDIGPGTFTVAGDIDPYGNYNTEARYGISFGQGKKNGGRVSFKNGGLASIL